MKTFKDLPVIPFETPAAWRAWLKKNHAKSTGLWLQIYKKDSGVATVTYAQALDEALCFGWIDSSKNKLDEASFVQRFSPRKSRSIWSKINREHVARLIAQKKMEAAGLRVIDEAKRNGQWDNAYDPQSKSKAPAELETFLAKNSKAKAFYEALNSVNRYAFCHRIQKTTSPEARAKKVAWAIGMLTRAKDLLSTGSLLSTFRCCAGETRPRWKQLMWELPPPIFQKRRKDDVQRALSGLVES